MQLQQKCFFFTMTLTKKLYLMWTGHVMAQSTKKVSIGASDNILLDQCIPCGEFKRFKWHQLKQQRASHIHMSAFRSLSLQWHNCSQVYIKQRQPLSICKCLLDHIFIHTRNGRQYQVICHNKEKYYTFISGNTSFPVYSKLIYKCILSVYFNMNAAC